MFPIKKESQDLIDLSIYFIFFTHSSAANFKGVTFLISMFIVLVFIFRTSVFMLAFCYLKNMMSNYVTYVIIMAYGCAEKKVGKLLEPLLVFWIEQE